MKRYPFPHTPKYRWLLLLTTILALVAVLPIAQRAQRESEGARRQLPLERAKKAHPNAVPGEILVRFRAGSTGKRLGRQVVTEKTGRQISMSIAAVSPAFEIVEGLRVARVNPADTSNAIEALRARSDVIYAEPNYIRKAMAVPNDPRYAEMWGLNNTGQRATFAGNPGSAGNDIRAQQAWNITTGSRSVVVGVIDTGIDINHEDLKDNIWTNTAEVPGNSVDDDGNGFVDDINGWDFAHNDATVFDYTEPTYPPSASYTGDIDDHGTHVAGTIGANGNNGIGVAGVNWQVSLLPLKFLAEDGFGSASDLLNAYAYAKSMRLLWQSSGGTKGANIRILNNSYGGSGFSQAEQDAIRELGDAGILFVVSAGNEASFNDFFPVYPANYISPNLISVAASGGGGIKAFFSNSGQATVNVTAPGEYILSTTPKNTYNFANGTSMAAPHVSGSAALVCAQFPSITMEKLRSVMMYSGYTAPWQYIDVFPISTGRAVDAGKTLQSITSPDVTVPGAISNLTASISDTFPSYFVIWSAPGDDGNVGRITAYELRFSDTSLNAANFDLARPLSGPVPNDPGWTQFVTVRVPWRHPSGFVGIRGVDEVGNKGPISSIPISVTADVGDPYTIAETAAAPVSTGGTALELIGDDQFKQVNLPFPFKFYGTDWNFVTVSTNGALHFGFAPTNGDAFSTVQRLSGTRMIAGLWDDLRTDKRPGDDVYIVQDQDRIIFRWQAVTFDTPISPTETRGENPVSFEIELRYDGTITMRYGNGNQKLLPVVGLGNGSPDPYVSDSHTFDDNLKNLTNAQAVVFARRNPTQRGVLTVASSNPASGLSVTVSPNDVSGSGNGTTQFTRTYNRGTTVTLTAPATVNGNDFQRWQRDGVDWSGNVSTNVGISGNVTMTAIYAKAPTLTVTSTNPGTGVTINVIPNDKDGSGNGTTPFTRTYNPSSTVNLTAPLTAGTSTFWKWQVDGVDYVQHQLATVTMDFDHTVTAIYVTPAATPTPTPVPGALAQPIAFTKPGTGVGSDIFLVNADGTNVVNLTDAQGDDIRPAWSPAGSRLAYTCLRQPDGSLKEPRRICVRNADGTGFAVLSNTLADDFGPVWSRDGNRIAFTTFSGGIISQPMLSIMNADGTGRFPMFGFNGAANPDWSPGDTSLVFEMVGSIWTFNRFTQNSLRLTNFTSDSRAHYSPDGSKIVFQSTRDGQAEIYVMNVDGTGQTRLTDNPAWDTAPAWSPDGTKILFTSLRDGPSTPALYLMNANGSNQTRVTAGSEGVWRSTPTAPVIFTEEGSANVAAFYSVTFLRGPFRIFDPHNFSLDGHARVILFTSNLGVTSPPVPQTSTLSVQANGINLPVENVGPTTGVSGLNGSYIIVRLPDGLPAGNLSVTVTLHGLTSTAATLPVVP